MKGLLIGISCGLVALVAWWLLPQIAHRASGPRAVLVATPPTIEFQGVNLVEYTGGAKLWDLAADRVDYDSDGQVAHLSRITARFWEGGRVVSTTVAPRARLGTRTRDLVMDGGIRIQSLLAKTEVRADQVLWQAQTSSLHASGSVSFVRGLNTLQAPELWANRSLVKVRMGSPVRARLAIETGWNSP